MQIGIRYKYIDINPWNNIKNINKSLTIPKTGICDLFDLTNNINVKKSQYPTVKKRSTDGILDNAEITPNEYIENRNNFRIPCSNITDLLTLYKRIR